MILVICVHYLHDVVRYPNGSGKPCGALISQASMRCVGYDVSCLHVFYFTCNRL